MKNRNSNLLSHPDRFLEDHISSVMDIASNFLERDLANSEDEILKDFLKIITFSHDIGKSTDFFQRYIRGEKSLKSKIETNHALLGGVIGFYLTKRYLKQKNIDNKFLLALGFILPKRHHSDLRWFYEDIILYDKDLTILKKQINSINKNAFDIFLSKINIDFLKFSFDEINLKEIKEELFSLRRYFRKIKKEKDLYFYVKSVFMFSLLLDSDKSDVGIKTDKNILFQEISFLPNLVENFLKKQPKSEKWINKLRNKAFKEVISNNIDLNQKIYSLTLPTGTGKTLISLSFALKLADKIKKEKDIYPKIIYSLPFLSIIDQNFKVFENVLKENNINIDSSILLKHHHLSEFKFRYENNEFDYDTSRILTEGWNSSIITTTFIQLFNTIIGFKNKTLRKFHKLSNSIIIIDEIQSIPHQYWLLIREVFKYLTEKFNLYIIFSTATQPIIFQKDDIKELSDYKKYFDAFNRYRIEIDTTSKTVDQFYDELKIDSNKRYLFILNTIKSAKQLYELIKKEKDALFLSTHIVPKERLERIKLLKKNKIKIAVSTQLVEAGVDIDFDIVYRDFAPFDSLIQSAGRCNREGLKEKGVFKIVKLQDENGRFYYSYIYDSFLVEKTKQILKKDCYEEKDVLNLVKDYYNLVKEGMSDQESLELLDKLYSLKFSAEKEKNQINSIADFSLIKEDVYKEDVFIELNEEAKEIWKEFSNIKQIKDIFDRKKRFDSIKANFYSYVISVPIEKNTPPTENNFYYVPNNLLENFYDKETGYKVEGDSFFEF